ncbi:MAG: hypothetical protein HPY58_13500 [Firmicutes bacterium]|nr:hypothetical protein [Bacillota bacterium]
MIAAFEVFEVRLTRNAEKDLLRLRDLTERAFGKGNLLLLGIGAPATVSCFPIKV